MNEDFSFCSRLPARQGGFHKVEKVSSDGKSDLRPAWKNELRYVAFNLARLPAVNLKISEDFRNLLWAQVSSFS